jgi:D-citramalate synthase
MAQTRTTRIQVMDTTLRDGEQTPEVSYAPEEKLQVAKMLLSDVGVDRIEVAGTRVSEGEREAARRICRWAKRAKAIDRVEMLGYCDGDLSPAWLAETGGRVLNLLVKGSEKHCREQLRMSPEQHRRKVGQTIAAAKKRRLIVNAYLEDWSQGVRGSPEYVFLMTRQLLELGVKRVYLADTLGVQSPDEASRTVDLMVSSFPDAHFEYHCHNDYGLANANCLAAVNAGARGVHTSVNGLGERAGNTRLAEVVAVLHDHGPFTTGVNERRLAGISRLVETMSGKDISANAPIVGADVFTQTAGIHADGDAKADLYETRLAPKRFGRERRYALGKLSGKASLDQNLARLGIELSADARDRVLQRIVELGDKKHTVVPEDLRFILADVLKEPAYHTVHVEHYDVSVASDAVPRAEVVVTVRGKRSRGKASGDGGYDAFMKALAKALARFDVQLPRLVDFRVRIPPGGRTSALVETVITWRDEKRRQSFSTLAVDTDQLAAAVLATEKMLNEVVTRRPRK